MTNKPLKMTSYVLQVGFQNDQSCKRTRTFYPIISKFIVMKLGMKLRLRIYE